MRKTSEISNISNVETFQFLMLHRKPPTILQIFFSTKTSMKSNSRETACKGRLRQGWNYPREKQQLAFDGVSVILRQNWKPYLKANVRAKMTGIAFSTYFISYLFQSACSNHSLISFFTKFFTKQNIFFDGSRKNPRNLTDVSHSSRDRQFSWFVRKFVENCVQEGWLELKSIFSVI